MGNTSRDRTSKYRHGNENRATKGFGQPKVPNIGMCSVCGKKTYSSRKLAKRAEKFSNLLNEHPVEVYRCHYNPEFWHLGGVGKAPNQS